MPAESRQKQLRFNRTEQSEPFSINWKNIVLSRKLGSTHYRLVCSGHCKRLQTTFQSQSTSIYRPITNPRSSKEFQAIKQEVNSLLSKGAIKQIPKSQAKFVSNLFTVPKKSGSLRPVINLKPLNQFLHLKTFKMEGLSDLKVLLEPNDFMITIDLSDAYMTLPIEEDSRNYLCFQFQDQMFNFVSFHLVSTMLQEHLQKL